MTLIIFASAPLSFAVRIGTSFAFDGVEFDDGAAFDGVDSLFAVADIHDVEVGFGTDGSFEAVEVSSCFVVALESLDGVLSSRLGSEYDGVSWLFVKDHDLAIRIRV